MLVRCPTALVAALLLPALAGACTSSTLEIPPPTPVDLPTGGPGGIGVGGVGGVGGAGGGSSPTDGPLPPQVDSGASDCVATSVLLPWTESMTAMRLEVATSTTSVAVMNRQANLLDVRTYTRGGSVLGGYQFAADTQLLSMRETRFLLVSRGQSGDIVATAIDPNLVGSNRMYSASANATEHILTAMPLATTVIVITTEHFVNLATGKTVPWSNIFPGEMTPFRTSVPYGLATDGSNVLMAWGAETNLRVALIDFSGKLVAQDQELGFLVYPSAQPPTAIPMEYEGLLLFDGNNVRATRIGLDLRRTVLGPNTQLKTFYRTAPRVAAIVLQNRPVAFWLTVFPDTDNSQGTTPHQLYGCELNLAAPATCLSTALIASTGLDGYGIGQEPVAAMALPDGSGFAIAHTDSDGRSWLNVSDLSCANRLTGP